MSQTKLNSNRVQQYSAFLELLSNKTYKDICGGVDKGAVCIQENKFLNKKLWKIGGFWIENPEDLFKWRKLNHLDFLPLMAHVLSSNVGGESFDHSNLYGYGADIILFQSERDKVFLYGGVLKDGIISVEVGFTGLGYQRKWGYQCWYRKNFRIDDMLEGSESEIELIRPSIAQDFIGSWSDYSWFMIEEDNYDFSLRGLFDDSVSSGFLELTGRPREAIADRVRIDPDWLCSGYEFSEYADGIVVDGIPIHNVEVRVSPKLTPFGVPSDEDKNAHRAKAPKVASSLARREFDEWCREVMSLTKTGPTYEACDLWANERGFRRDDVRTFRRELDESLRNKVGRPSKKQNSAK